MDVPTEDEMAEIEPSSRLYEQNGALYMTVSVLYGVEDGRPDDDADQLRARRQPAGHRALRDAQAHPRFSDHARRDRELVRDAPTALFRMLDAIIDRLADELENVSARHRGDFAHTFSIKEWKSGAFRPSG